MEEENAAAYEDVLCYGRSNYRTVGDQISSRFLSSSGIYNKNEDGSVDAEKNERLNVDLPALELNQTTSTALVGEGKPARSQFNFIQSITVLLLC